MRYFVLVLGLLASSLSTASSDVLMQRHAPDAYLAQHKHASVKVLTVGEGIERAYVFIPNTPSPKGAPLVLFHHGWLGMNPKNFGVLIDHLARRGAVVIYPVYQDGNDTPPQAVTQWAGNADAAALRELDRRYPGLVNPEKTLYFGFSMGAAISLNLALAPEHFNLPPPKAMLLAAPGDAHHVARGPKAASIIGKVEKLPKNLPVVMVSGAADTSIGVPTARQIAKKWCHLPPQKRALIFLPSDSDDGKRIQAGHGSPGAPDSRYNFADSRGAVPALILGRADFEPSPSLNLLDFYGYWRLTTRLLDWVNGGEYPAEIFKDSPENRFLGHWPSGKPYASATVEDVCR